LQARPDKKGAPVAAVAVIAATDSRVRRVSAHRAQPEKSNRWKIVGLIGGIVIGLMVIGGALALLARTPAAVAPSPIDTLAPTSTSAPIVTATHTPALAQTPTAPPATATLRSIATSTPAATPTATPSPTRTALRVRPTATPIVSIAPLTLAFPRSERRDNLSLTFRTNVLPADAGIIGTLSLAVPAVEPLVINRDLAQVGSGEQVLRVGVTINCGSIVEPITSQQIVLTIRDDTGQTLSTQTLDYAKRWCQ